jgi:hypothetical protein
LMLPVATIVASLMSALLIFGIAHSTSQPLSARDRAAFVRGCERSVGAPVGPIPPVAPGPLA